VNHYNEKSNDLLNEYSLLAKWRERKIKSVIHNHEKLNQFHDLVIKRSVKLAMCKVRRVWGDPPARFAFILMGSGGRFEQSVWSDQDHGIIFECDERNQPYFLALGSEIAKALYKAGYEYCDGNVMSLNPIWCKSIYLWKEQIGDWLEKESLESLRYFSTFFDSRVLIGEGSFLEELKAFSFIKLKEKQTLYIRLLENVSHLRKGIGPFGQLLPAASGENAGTINLKETVFFPYVNSLRLLALMEGITVPSTLSRFDQLPSHYYDIKAYKSVFLNLLNFRLFHQKDASDYKHVHLLNVLELSKQDKKLLKYFMKRGYGLFSHTTELIHEGVRRW
jgi:CBS domain-containing protein